MNRLSMKDRITIYIKKKKDMPWKLGVALCAVLFAVIVICGFSRTGADQAPAELTSDQNAFRMTFTGDLKITEQMRENTRKGGYSGLFDALAEYWKDADHIVANVDGPVLRYEADHYTSTRNKKLESVYLRPRALRGFHAAGIDLLCFANDETYNYGRTGIASTISLLDEYQYDYLGIAADSSVVPYKILEFTTKNESGGEETRRVAVFNFNDHIMNNSTVNEENPGIFNTSLANVNEQIYNVSQETDYVIVYAHFQEQHETSAITDREEQTARGFVNAGADLVVGTNSDKIQSAEKYGDSYIVYGLGALVSDEESSFELDSAMLDLVISEAGEVSVYLTPLRMQDGCPIVTKSPVYQRRIQKKLTSELDRGDYSITKEGLIALQAGQLEEPAGSGTNETDNPGGY